MLYYGASEEGAAPAENALVLPAAFLLVALLFACLGRPIGLLLTEVRPPLRAYGLDVAGSLAGIAAFFMLSLTERPPAVWFGGLTVAVLVLAGSRLRNLLLTLAPMAAVIVIATAIGGENWWSPYYRVGLTAMQGHRNAWVLTVNSIGHQIMQTAEEKEPFYRVPYETFGDGTFQRALIIGAGSGSDAAVALRHGVQQIDAVEIDPVISRLGRRYHPDQPFSDPGVTVHVDDGRAFLRRSREQYDLIVFALPDSLTLTSQFASLRLESFLFTEEAFAGGAGPPGPGRGPRPLQLLPRDVAAAEAGRDAGDDLRRAPLRGQLRGLGAGRGVDRRAPPEPTRSPPGPTSTAPTARSRRKERR